MKKALKDLLAIAYLVPDDVWANATNRYNETLGNDYNNFIFACDNAKAALAADDCLNNFTCCGGNDDSIEGNGYPKAHCMDCDDHPGITPSGAK